MAVTKWQEEITRQERISPYRRRIRKINLEYYATMDVYVFGLCLEGFIG